MQSISRGGGYYSTNVGDLCARFVYMGSMVKNQVENGLNRIFGLWGNTIDVYDQAVFTLKDSGLHD